MCAAACVSLLQPWGIAGGWGWGVSNINNVVSEHVHKATNCFLDIDDALHLPICLFALRLDIVSASFTFLCVSKKLHILQSNNMLCKEGEREKERVRERDSPSE